jgi:two-component system sensor histidine kinase VicK
VSLVTDSVVNELEDRAANKDLKLEWQRPTESMHTKMDEEKIRNVIFNFVDNAIKYSDGGTIRINAQVKSNRIYVTVRDEGIGFDKPDEEKLFKKFQRGDNARKREVNSSTGLGLYIARMFVEGHGGEVWAKSEGLGKGSEFGLWLPIK